MARIKLAIPDIALSATLKAMLEAEGHVISAYDPEVIFAGDSAQARTEMRHAPTIVLATASEIPQAVETMREGVWGYLFVPLQPGEAGALVQRALGHAAPLPGDPGAFRTLEEVEAEHIQSVLRLCGHNQARAARILGIGRNTLWRKLKKIETQDRK